MIHVFTVMGTPKILYRLVFGNPVMKALYRGTFRKLNLTHVKWHNFTAEHLSSAKRTAVLNHLDQYLK